MEASALNLHYTKEYKEAASLMIVAIDGETNEAQVLRQCTTQNLLPLSTQKIISRFH